MLISTRNLTTLSLSGVAEISVRGEGNIQKIIFQQILKKSFGKFYMNLAQYLKHFPIFSKKSFSKI